jgi:predicted kinase
MPKLYMLIGVPGAGKSTWLAQQPFDWNRTVILSTDAIIERRAAAQGKTYDQVFRKEIKSATAEMYRNLADAVTQGADLIWDQTNVTAAARTKKLAMVPDEYERVAVMFRTPDRAEHERRLASRAGKTIPANVIAGMISQLEPATEAEGFDQIITV